MGALHGGHQALVEAARAENDIVVVSLFVNPAQFGPGEDLDRYPRDEEADLGRARDWGVDLRLRAARGGDLPRRLPDLGRGRGALAGPRGRRRAPATSAGVATVCLKLFNLVRPRRAYFGQKDAQQAAVVDRLVRDLDVPVEIRLVATVRDEDGLALSSRNAQLSDGGARGRAGAAAGARGRGRRRTGRDGTPPRPRARSSRRSARLEPDYVEVARLNGRTYLLAAVRAGRTRLIDNVILEGEHHEPLRRRSRRQSHDPRARGDEARGPTGS